MGAMYQSMRVQDLQVFANRHVWEVSNFRAMSATSTRPSRSRISMMARRRSFVKHVLSPETPGL